MLIFKLHLTPEFLKEGIHDFFHPDRIIIGIENNDVVNVLNELYGHLLPS